MKVSLIQYSAGTDVQGNFNKAMALLNTAVKEHPDVVCFPESFLYCGPDKKAGEMETDCLEVRAFQKFARESKVNLILGSIKIKGKGKATNTCLVINRSGELVHRYDKIFMYTINKGGVVYNEAEEVEPGSRIGLFELDGIKMGVGICVDIRFPFYFSELVRRGAQGIFLPAVMRKLTGAGLWGVLPAARAIESQAYFCACSQTGNLGGSKTGDAVGRSKVISFNGEVISSLGEDEGICTAEIDLKAQDAYRKEILMLEQFNRRFR